jgi:outer membrane protein assembly factor BamB
MLGRHIRCASRAAAAAAVAVLFTLSARPTPASAQLAQPPGLPVQPPGGAAGGRAPAVNRRVEARKAPALVLNPAWVTDLEDAAVQAPAADETHGYVVLRSSGLAALDLGTGAVAWKKPFDEVAVPPVAASGLVFVAHGREVEAVESSSGARRWIASLDGPPSAPLLVGPGRLFAFTRGHAAVALRAGTGETLWTRTFGEATPTHVASGGGALYCALDDGRVVALDAVSGATRWESKLPSAATAIAPAGDRVVIGGKDKFLYCLSASRGKIAWRRRAGGAAVGPIASDGRRLYYAALDNVLRAIDRRHGQQHWKAALSHRPVGGVVLSARLLWVAGLAAEVAAFQPIDGSAAGRSPVAGELSAAPAWRRGEGAAADGVFVVTGDGRAQWLVPGLAPLEAKPIPGLPIDPPRAAGRWPGGPPPGGDR